MSDSEHTVRQRRRLYIVRRHIVVGAVLSLFNWLRKDYMRKKRNGQEDR